MAADQEKCGDVTNSAPGAGAPRRHIPVFGGNTNWRPAWMAPGKCVGQVERMRLLEADAE